MYCGIGTTIAIPIYKVLPYLVIGMSVLMRWSKTLNVPIIIHIACDVIIA